MMMMMMTMLPLTMVVQNAIVIDYVTEFERTFDRASQPTAFCFHLFCLTIKTGAHTHTKPQKQTVSYLYPSLPYHLMLPHQNGFAGLTFYLFELNYFNFTLSLCLYCAQVFNCVYVMYRIQRADISGQQQSIWLRAIGPVRAKRSIIKQRAPSVDTNPRFTLSKTIKIFRLCK